MYVYIYIHTYYTHLLYLKSPYVCIYKELYIYIYVHIYTHIYTYIYIYICTCTYAHMCMPITLNGL